MAFSCFGTASGRSILGNGRKTMHDTWPKALPRVSALWCSCHMQIRAASVKPGTAHAVADEGGGWPL